MRAETSPGSATRARRGPTASERLRPSAAWASACWPCGVLVTPEVRDKDAAGAAILLAELAAQERNSGRTLVDYLDDIYLRYGYSANRVTSMVMAGAEGSNHIQKIQATLRQHPPLTIGGLKVIEMIDHQDPGGIHGPILSDTDRVARNVLVFRLENETRIIVRPSGTEPKNKTYVEVRSAPLGEGADSETLAHTKAAMNALAQRVADDFTLQMLAIIGVDLPRYALRISGLVPLDRKIAFGREFLPALETRALALCRQQTSREEVSKWIDESLWNYGEDARALVADAVHGYVDVERGRSAGLSGTEAGERLRCLELISSLFPGATEY